MELFGYCKSGLWIIYRKDFSALFVAFLRVYLIKSVIDVAGIDLEVDLK